MLVVSLFVVGGVYKLSTGIDPADKIQDLIFCHIHSFSHCLDSQDESGTVGPGKIEPWLWRGELTAAAGYTKFFQVNEIVNLLPASSTPDSWDFKMLRNEHPGRLFLQTSSAKTSIMTEEEPGIAACKLAIYSSVDVYLQAVGNRWLCVDTNDNHLAEMHVDDIAGDASGATLNVTVWAPK